MKSHKKYIFILLVLFLPHQILSQEKEEKHTLAVTGIAIPIFLFTYHFGLSYDYLLTNPNKNLGFSVGAAGRYGYSSGVPGDDKIMSKSDFLRSDTGGKVWWYFDSSDTKLKIQFKRCIPAHGVEARCGWQRFDCRPRVEKFELECGAVCYGQRSTRFYFLLD